MIWCEIACNTIMLWNNIFEQTKPDFRMSPNPLKLLLRNKPNVAFNLVPQNSSIIKCMYYFFINFYLDIVCATVFFSILLNHSLQESSYKATFPEIIMLNRLYKQYYFKNLSYYLHTSDYAQYQNLTFSRTKNYYNVVFV